MRFLLGNVLGIRHAGLSSAGRHPALAGPPLIAHFSTRRDARAWSPHDFVSRAAFQRTMLYRKLYRPFGIEYQLALLVPYPDRAPRVLALHRKDPIQEVARICCRFEEERSAVEIRVGVASAKLRCVDSESASLILLHAPEQVGVIQHDAILIHGQLRLEATAVEVLEEVEPVPQARIGLRLGVHCQVRRQDPSHAELPPLTDRHRLAANREGIGERGWPDIDIYAAIELVDGPAIAVSPSTLAVRLQTQRLDRALRRDDQLGIEEPPRFVPGQAVGEPERTMLLVEREDDAVSRTLSQ
jgi:hypothetical protein